MKFPLGKIFFFLLLIKGLLYAEATWIEDIPFSASVAHLEGKGVGYDTGYTSLSTVALKNYHFGTIFIDGKVHYLNKDKWASNIGICGRVLWKNSLIGLNFYHDYRQTKCAFYQGSIGLEFLHPLFDFQINGYFPLSKLKKRIYDCFFNDYIGDYYVRQSMCEVMLNGADAELGTSLGTYFHVHFYGQLGGYYLLGPCALNTFGEKLSLRASFKSHIYLDLFLTNDSLFHTRFAAKVSFNIPLMLNYTKNKVYKLPIPTRRRELIPLMQKNVWDYNY